MIKNKVISLLLNLQGIGRKIFKMTKSVKNNVDTKTNSDSQEDYDQSMLDSFVPESPNQSYDVKEIINTIIDPNSFLEVQERTKPSNEMINQVSLWLLENESNI